LNIFYVSIQYKFEEIKIEWIHKIYSTKKHKLYDIEVEDDESFIARGVVVHNCRCTLVQLPDGFGFNDKGEMEFKGSDYKYKPE